MYTFSYDIWVKWLVFPLFVSSWWFFTNPSWKIRANLKVHHRFEHVQTVQRTSIYVIFDYHLCWGCIGCILGLRLICWSGNHQETVRKKHIKVNIQKGVSNLPPARKPSQKEAGLPTIIWRCYVSVKEGKGFGTFMQVEKTSHRLKVLCTVRANAWWEQ